MNRSFRGSETILHDTLMMDTCPYIFVKAHKMYNTKNEPNIDYGLQMIMCQYRFFDYNKYTTVVLDIDIGGSCAHVGLGSRWELWYFFCSVFL